MTLSLGCRTGWRVNQGIKMDWENKILIKTEGDGSSLCIQIDSVSTQTQSHSNLNLTANTLNTMGPFCDYPEFSKASDPERYMTSVVHQTRPLDDWATAMRGIALNLIGEAELHFSRKRAQKVQFYLPKRGFRFMAFSASLFAHLSCVLLRCVQVLERMCL